ncbi:MAG: protein 1, chloroplastic-like [Candidatus Saccharibacteria bacterium]|nr:protein 1, chloroplastic-like [Candidatus Saccharibacteria bacterium]
MAQQRKPSIAALKRQRTRRLARLIARAYILQQRGKQTELYTMICDEFVDMGGVYVKFLQGVLLNNVVMKKWQNPNKMRIFENLDTVEMDIVQVLQRELKPDALRDIALVQPKPFAAGSFGQVYYGQHINGKAIIIKVLRPQVADLLAYDLRLLTMFTRSFAKREYRNIGMNLNSAFREFRHSTLREADYKSEALFAAEMFEAYMDHPRIVIPKTYLELCTANVIVQDYLPGLSVVEVLKAKQDGVDPVAFVKEQTGSDLDTQLISFGSALMAGSITMPRIQGDPHPGNIRLLPDNKVGTIDFGISASRPRNQPAFFQIINSWHKMYAESEDDFDVVSLFTSFMRFFVNDLYNALRKLGGRVNINSSAGSSGSYNLPDNLVNEVGKVVRNIMQSAIGTQDVKTIIREGRTLDLFNNVVNRGNRFGLVMRIESTEVLRAAQTYMALVNSLGRRDKVFAVMFETALNDIEKAIPDIRYQSDDAMTMNQAYETIHGWLERVASRDPDLFQELVAKVKIGKDISVPTEPTIVEEKHA